jgi:heterodisulfide reductase subunit C
MEKIDAKNLDPQFKYDVATHPGGENINLCFACGTCTAGCPVAEVDTEFNPRRIIRQVLLGMRREVLGSPVIWRCVQCYSCTAKCPQNVNFRDVMKALREMAAAEGYADPALAAQVEQLGKFSQKLRRDLLEAMLADHTRFERIKGKLEQLAGSE